MLRNPEEGGPKKKVLVIDSHEDLRQLLALRLEVLGLEVLETGRAEEISDLLLGHSPDLVISEWSVPGLQGMEMLEALGPRERNVLFYTEESLEPFQDLLNRSNVQGWVPKKNRSDLIEKVKALMVSKKMVSQRLKPESERHILVIEDSATVRGFVRLALVRSIPGCVIREAEDGRAALSEMAQKKVDLIITDLEMPGMDGRTFLRAIRANALLKKKPVMVLSGSITPDLLSEFKDDSYMWFLEKPSTTQEIVEIARRLLGDGRA